MVGQCRKASAHKVYEPYEPPDAHTHNTANPVEGEFLAQQAFQQGTILSRHETLSREKNKLATAGLTLVFLVTVMDMPIFGEVLDPQAGHASLMSITMCKPPWYSLVILVNDTRVSRAKHHSYNTTCKGAAAW
jgi:hypothetical protein